MGILIRNGGHMRPMLAVLERANIGQLDKYHRGRWIEKSDLPAILDAIRTGPGAQKGGAADDDWLCHGTNIHNSVWFQDVKDLFAE